MYQRSLALVVTGAALLAAPVAQAFPPAGSYNYSSFSNSVPSFRLFTRIADGSPPSVLTADGAITTRCKRNGRTSRGLTDFAVGLGAAAPAPLFTTKPNGRFSSKWLKSIGSTQTAKSKFKIKGVFKGSKLSATVYVREKGPIFGKCSGKGKIRAKAKPVG